MTTAYEIPLKNEAQQLNITIEGVVYSLALAWNTFAGAWYLDVSDQNLTPILQGVKLLPGGDLLAPYAYLGFGFELVVQTDHDTFAAPTYANLGVDSHLYAVFA
jgi:hypothetical protein